MQKDVNFLGGQRFDKEANKIYKVPVDKLPKKEYLNTGTDKIESHVDFESEEFRKVLIDFINHHKEKQVPRLEELKRYYMADNNIKYRADKSPNRADNRIASDYAAFIVEFKQGVLLGNPVIYNGEETIVERVEDFSSKNNEDYHNQLMALDDFIYGRAYELVTRNEEGIEIVTKFDVTETFIIYDTSNARNSVCGVRYYPIEFNNVITTVVEIYANDGFLYVFETENIDLENLELKEGYPEEQFFNAVQINEWINNEDRLGDFEKVLDKIDAYDLSQSEMANFQQDSSEALLVIKGNPDTLKKADGTLDKEGIDYAQRARMLILGDKKNNGDGLQGAEPDAKFLIKEYDVQGIEAYNDRTVADILQFTKLVDFTDENMGGNQSGVGFRFKGWNSDNDRKNKERMITKALMRRLRLLTYSWSIKDKISSETDHSDLYDKVNDIVIKFTPNVPQSDKEVMEVIKGMDGLVSDQTIYEMAERLTGVSAEEESKRVDGELKDRLNEPFEFEKKVEAEEVEEK